MTSASYPTRSAQQSYDETPDYRQGPKTHLLAIADDAMQQIPVPPEARPEDQERDQ